MEKFTEKFAKYYFKFLFCCVLIYTLVMVQMPVS